jgi:hypothetical protein
MMTTEMRQRVIQLVDRLPPESLPEAIAFLESLSIKSQPPSKNIETATIVEENGLLTIDSPAIDRIETILDETRAERINELSSW